MRCPALLLCRCVSIPIAATLRRREIPPILASSSRNARSAEPDRHASHGDLESGGGRHGDAGDPRSLPPVYGPRHGHRGSDGHLARGTARPRAARHLRGPSRRGALPHRRRDSCGRRRREHPAPPRGPQHEPREHLRRAARGAVGRPREGHRARGPGRGRHRADSRVLRRRRAPGRGGRLRRRGDPRRARLSRQPVPVAARQPTGRPVGRQPGEPGPVRAGGRAADARGRRRTPARVVPARGGRGRAGRVVGRRGRAGRALAGSRWHAVPPRIHGDRQRAEARAAGRPVVGPAPARRRGEESRPHSGDRCRRHHRSRPGRARAGRGTRRRSSRSGAPCSRTRVGRGKLSRDATKRSSGAGSVGCATISDTRSAAPRGARLSRFHASA